MDSSPGSESLFAIYHISKLTNPLLPLSPLQQVSPHFAMCHISKLTNPFLPLPPLQEVSPHLQYAMFLSSPTNSSLFLLSSKWVLVCHVPHFQAHEHAPSSSSPLASEPSVTCHISKLTNVHLPLPPLQLVSSCL